MERFTDFNMIGRVESLSHVRHSFFILSHAARLYRSFRHLNRGLLCSASSRSSSNIRPPVNFVLAVRQPQPGHRSDACLSSPEHNGLPPRLEQVKLSIEGFSCSWHSSPPAFLWPVRVVAVIQCTNHVFQIRDATCSPATIL